MWHLVDWFWKIQKTSSEQSACMEMTLYINWIMLNMICCLHRARNGSQSDKWMSMANCCCRRHCYHCCCCMKNKSNQCKMIWVTLNFSTHKFCNILAFCNWHKVKYTMLAQESFLLCCRQFKRLEFQCCVLQPSGNYKISIVL